MVPVLRDFIADFHPRQTLASQRITIKTLGNHSNRSSRCLDVPIIFIATPQLTNLRSLFPLGTYRQPYYSKVKITLVSTYRHTPLPWRLGLLRIRPAKSWYCVHFEG